MRIEAKVADSTPHSRVKETKRKSSKARHVGAGNFVSQIFFIWVFWLIVLIRKAKDITDLHLTLRQTETAMFNHATLDSKWKEEQDRASRQNRLPQIRRAIFKAFGSLFVLNGVWKVIWAGSLWFGAYWLLKQTINHVRIKSTDHVAGHMYAFGLLVSSMVATVAIHQLLSQSGRLGMRVRAALMVQIYKKCLLLARVRGGSGDLVNLVVNDVGKIGDACTNCHYLWSAWIEVAIIMTLSFIELGYSAFPALGIIIILAPIQIYLAKIKSRSGYQTSLLMSKRVHLISEILSAIKLIKFHAWEKPFQNRISKIREEELNTLRTNFIVNCVNFTAVFCLPVLASLLCLLMYWSLGNDYINPVTGFTVVSVFNTFRYPLLMLPLAVSSASDALIALRRLDEYFSLSEVQKSVRYPNDEEQVIKLKDASFNWTFKSNEVISNFVLKDLNLTIRRGQLVAVVGDIGSGKSAFLAALLGQMNQLSGENKVLGSISYCPQEPWLINTTLRENILFGSPFDPEKYQMVIETCALTTDLALMKSGDETEIGERGINLSGGQRQRISLARCVYKMSDVVLLDDPLSAVDQKVGRHIFNRCIRGLLKDKTVIFVTHQLQYLNQVDEVILIKDGCILKHDTVVNFVKEPESQHIESIGIKGSETEHTVETPCPAHEKLSLSETMADTKHEKSKKGFKLVQDDKSVYFNKSSFLLYLKSGNGALLTLTIIAFFFVVHSVRVLSDYWLSMWFGKSIGLYKGINNAQFIVVYSIAVVLFTIGVFARGIVFCINSMRKSLVLHKELLESVLHARMRFFDTTPIGRVLSVFARHQYAFDFQLTESLMQLLQFLPLCLGAILICMCVMYQTVGVFGSAAFICALVLLFVRGAEQKLMNKESVTKSAIPIHLTTSIEGLYSIRAYQAETRFVDEFCRRIDENHKYAYALMEVKCWLAFYLDIVTSLIIYTTAIVVVETVNDYPASISGLVLSNVLQLLVFLQWTVRTLNEVREKLESVKQIVYYSQTIELETTVIAEGDKDKPAGPWPDNGRIKFENLSLKYHSLAPPVLKNVSIDIRPKEKIGIVGRTGSGKSTLLISLLRIVEPASGRILIDGVDLTKVQLEFLRSQIAIIPQEPVLFVGTVRENIDLFNKNTDTEIWSALDSVYLGDFIRSLKGGLDSTVIENGKNFSVGQRQLFCIARAILSKTKILVLDEATAAVDMQTDLLIQKSIKQNFGELTVLTIAHRLNTIIDSDRVLVMDAGQVVEFDTPLALLNISDSSFARLVSETGAESFAKLKSIAEAKEQSRLEDNKAILKQ